MRIVLEFLVRFSRNPIVLLVSFAGVVLIPSFHFDQDEDRYLCTFIVAIPLIIFLVSYKYFRNDDEIFADDGFNK